MNEERPLQTPVDFRRSIMSTEQIILFRHESLVMRDVMLDGTYMRMISSLLRALANERPSPVGKKVRLRVELEFLPDE